ncbi:MAG: L-rhamnose mutarotase [Rhodobacterales bacterium]
MWPELSDLLRDAGVTDYSIHHDSESNALFAVLWRHDDHGMAALPGHPVMQKWWAHMADLMEVNADHSPKVVVLETMFHLP